ncbi:MAG: TfoX/Sxy family protein [Coprobacillaceae bacterium]
MASSQSLVEFVCEQLRDAGEIRYRKMFGEYGIYCNDIYFAMVCDDQFLVKITEEGKAYLKEYETAYPYEGAKPALLIKDIDNRELLSELTKITCENLPKPKPRKSKK